MAKFLHGQNRIGAVMKPKNPLALDEALEKALIEAMRDALTIRQLKDRIAKLEAALTSAREALGYYGKHKRLEWDDHESMFHGAEIQVTKTDFGKRAREALKKIDKALK